MSEVYAGLDISDKQTHISMMDALGAVAWRGKCASDPQAILVMLGKQTSRLGIVLVRAVLETGPLSVFLHHGLRARGVPVVCIRARHAKGVLSTALNKTDVNDAEGLAQLARTGWYKAVHVKDAESHIARAEQKVRARLVWMKTGCKNQLRGLLKVFGLRLGKVTTPAKRAERLEVLFAQEPRLREALGPLVAVLEALEREQSVLDRKLKARAARDAVTRRLMTAPGVGHWVAALYKAGIEDPGRFARSAEVGAYVGLSPKRYQSGEMDYDGGISRRGDKELRHALYEAANSILGRLKRPCALRDWGLALQERKGSKRARVAVARKLAVILHKRRSRLRLGPGLSRADGGARRAAAPRPPPDPRPGGKRAVTVHGSRPRRGPSRSPHSFSSGPHRPAPPNQRAPARNGDRVDNREGEGRANDRKTENRQPDSRLTAARHARRSEKLKSPRQACREMKGNNPERTKLN